jgi:hypothetical protein
MFNVFSSFRSESNSLRIPGKELGLVAKKKGTK